MAISLEEREKELFWLFFDLKSPFIPRRRDAKSLLFSSQCSFTSGCVNCPDLFNLAEHQKTTNRSLFFESSRFSIFYKSMTLLFEMFDVASMEEF